MKTFKSGDMIDTTAYGFVTVQSCITIEENNNSKYNKLGGRTLYWVQDVEGEDICLWDTELTNILTDDENLYDDNIVGDTYILDDTGTDFE